MPWSVLMDPAQLVAGAITRLQLLDPPRSPVALVPGHLDVYRPGAARYAGRTLEWLEIRSSSATTPITAPCKSVVRVVALDSVTKVLELSPLPFSIADTLRALPPGVPTFYVTPFDPTLLDDMIVDAGQPLAYVSLVSSVQIAVQFQDPFTTPARTWIEIIGRALPAAEQQAWLAQLQIFSRSSMIVTDHVGTPQPGIAIDVAVVDGVGATLALESRSADSSGDLEASVALTPIALPTGALTSLYAPPAGTRVELRTTSSGDRLPVFAFYESPAQDATGSAGPDRALVVPQLQGIAHRTLQILDLGAWLPRPTPTLATDTAPKQFHRDCHVEPLVDGLAVYERMRTELDAATGAGFGAHLLGWVFIDFAMGLEDGQLTFTERAKAILESGGDIRILTNKFINPADVHLTTTQFDAAILLIILCLVTAGVVHEVGPTSSYIAVLWFLLAMIGSVITHFVDIPSKLPDIVPFPDARPVLDKVNENTSSPVARFSPPRAAISDNPLAANYSSPLFGIEADIASVGSNHSKMQVLRYRDPVEPDDSQTNAAHVAYVGGIDINKNRVDTPAHQVGSYHDVHARLRGSVVADAFNTFVERWNEDVSDNDLTIATPAPESLRTYETDGHLAQLARTYHRPRSDASKWSFAPEGDDGAMRATLAAIAAARDVIYIEDQYMTPNDRWLDVLCNAATHCRRLAILVPDETDQPFGVVRQQIALGRLADAWGDRMVVGKPTQQAILGAPDTATSVGRANLFEPCDPTTDEIEVGPPSRVPSAPPTWCWIEGELMLVTEISGLIQNGDQPARRRLHVIRGSLPSDKRWNATTRAHRKGAPVTFAGIHTTFVHAKTMMVDDVFVSIGSMNLNRRGFFHDGETNIFAIPQRLQSSETNPARVLRTRLWAEQLGMPPELGRALFRDPLSSFDLLLRPRLLGNRYTPLSVMDAKPYMALTDMQIYPINVFKVLGLLGAMPNAAILSLHQRAWNLLGDPTSDLDPDPQLGPGYTPP